MNIDPELRTAVEDAKKEFVGRVLRVGVSSIDELRRGRRSGLMANVIRATVLGAGMQLPSVGLQIQELQEIAFPMGATWVARNSATFRPDDARSLIYRQLAECVLRRLGVQPSSSPRVIAMGEWLRETPAAALGERGVLEIKKGLNVQAVLFAAGLPVFFDSDSWIYLVGLGERARAVRVMWAGSTVSGVFELPDFVSGLEFFDYLLQE